MRANKKKKGLASETKHYVEYMFPGILISETSSKEIAKRPTNEKGFRMADGAFAYSFYDIPSYIDSAGVRYSGPPTNVSPIYIRGVTYSLHEVRMLFPHHHVLIQNMELNHFESVIMTGGGNFYPMSEKYVVI